jgi:hypothetical protein
MSALLALVVTSVLGAAPVASAKAKTCAEQIVADWYGDGRVDKIFPLKCYQEAIRSLPVDVLDYSNAKEDILRALAFARKDQSDPGPGGTGDPGSTDTTSTDPGGTGPDGGSGPGDTGGETSASGDVDTSGPASLPIPLLILGGLALLLLAAGGAGYLSRRAQARREGGPPNPA